MSEHRDYPNERTWLGVADRIDCLDHGYVMLLDVAGSDIHIARHARTSTGKHDTDRTEAEDRKLIHYLFKNRHTSPFEMAKMWFEVHLPIFVWRQWARHRMQNMNEISGRYAPLPDVFYIPTRWRKQAETNKQSSVEAGDFNPPIAINSDWNSTQFEDTTRMLKAHCTIGYRMYEGMLNAGVAKEQARMVLSLNIYTKMHVCFDLHNLLHFIRLRDDSHAQSEIQEYGRALGKFVASQFPWTWEAFQRYQVRVIDSEERTITLPKVT